MRPSAGDADKGDPHAEPVRSRAGSEALLSVVLEVLDDAKAEDVVSIDIKGKSSIGDFMVVASGRSQRHVGAIADQALRKLKEQGLGRASAEGMPHCDWVLIDTGDIIVHIFRPEVRDFYNLEKMWSADRPDEMMVI
jgi:ribosome-associated protein